MQPAQPDKRPTAKLQTRKLEKPTGPAVPAGRVLSRQQILSQLNVMATKGASSLEMRNWAKQAGADPMELEHMVDQASRGAGSGRLTAAYTRTSTRQTGTVAGVAPRSTRSKSGVLWLAIGAAMAVGGGYMSWRHYEAAEAASTSVVTTWWAVIGVGVMVILKGLLDLRKVG